MIGRSLPTAGSTYFEKAEENSRDGFLEFKGTLQLKSHGEELPTVFLLPQNWNRQVVLWFDLAGKSGVYATDGQPHAQISKLLKAGFAVGSPDLYLTGDFTENHQPVAQMPIVANPRADVYFECEISRRGSSENPYRGSKRGGRHRCRSMCISWQRRQFNLRRYCWRSLRIHHRNPRRESASGSSEVRRCSGNPGIVFTNEACCRR